jgi:hypothetical protein
MPCCLGLKSKAEISAVPMGLPIKVVWIIAKVWMKASRKIGALLPRIEIQG